MSTTSRSSSDCGRPRPVELQMSVKSGSDLTLLSCNACEHRSWLVNGEVAALEAVLAAAAGDEDFVLAQGRRALRERKTTAPFGPPAR